MSRYLKLAAAFLGMALSAVPAARAQGCILCYTSLSESSSAAKHSFMLGMFVLLIPALTMMIGVALFIYFRTRTVPEFALAPKKKTVFSSLPILSRIARPARA